MAVSAEFMATVRVVALGVVGLACVGYTGLALMADRPDPVGWYWPATAGLLAGLVITFAALVAGPRQARAATDELYRAVNHRAQRQAYWLSMALFVVLAVAAAQGWIGHRTAMAVLGCLMGASYLLLFVWHDLRTR